MSSLRLRQHRSCNFLGTSLLHSLRAGWNSFDVECHSVNGPHLCDSRVVSAFTHEETPATCTRRSDGRQHGDAPLSHRRRSRRLLVPVPGSWRGPLHALGGGLELLRGFLLLLCHHDYHRLRRPRAKYVRSLMLGNDVISTTKVHISYSAELQYYIWLYAVTTGGRCSWLRHCAIRQEVADSIPDGFIGIFKVI